MNADYAPTGRPEVLALESTAYFIDAIIPKMQGHFQRGTTVQLQRSNGEELTVDTTANDDDTHSVMLRKQLGGLSIGTKYTFYANHAVAREEYLSGQTAHDAWGMPVREEKTQVRLSDMEDILEVLRNHNMVLPKDARHIMGLHNALGHHEKFTPEGFDQSLPDWLFASYIGDASLAIADRAFWDDPDDQERERTRMILKDNETIKNTFRIRKLAPHGQKAEDLKPSELIATEYAIIQELSVPITHKDLDKLVCGEADMISRLAGLHEDFPDETAAGTYLHEQFAKNMVTCNTEHVYSYIEEGDNEGRSFTRIKNTVYHIGDYQVTWREDIDPYSVEPIPPDPDNDSRYIRDRALAVFKTLECDDDGDYFGDETLVSPNMNAISQITEVLHSLQLGPAPRWG